MLNRPRIKTKYMRGKEQSRFFKKFTKKFMDQVNEIKESINYVDPYANIENLVYSYINTKRRTKYNWK